MHTDGVNMNYLKLLIISFVLLSTNLSAELPLKFEKSHVAVEEKSAAMRALREKYAKANKAQWGEVDHSVKKGSWLPKDTPLPKKIKSSNK